MMIYAKFGSVFSSITQLLRGYVDTFIGLRV